MLQMSTVELWAMALLSLIVPVHPPCISLVLQTCFPGREQEKQRNSTARQLGVSSFVLGKGGATFLKMWQQHRSAQLFSNMPQYKKNVKIRSILLERWLQTSCSVGRQMGMYLPICMMPVFKNAVPGPHCAGYCTNGTKGSPNRQANCQARS